MTDFLLELRSEEIPARMQANAREDLARLFAAELAEAGIAAIATVTYATPRRLALIARDLPLETAAVSEEIKGPRTSAPPQALEGFLRKTGLTRADLTERDGILYAVTEKPGRATADVLAAAIPAIVRAFPWPKSMRWGAASTTTASLRWVRPLHGIVALFGETIVPCEIAGIVSSATTLGHRFHHPGGITIGGAHDYVEKLRACHVVVDQDERAQIIALGATMAAAKVGLTLVRDEGLLIENAGLTEWPMPLPGRFDPEFLDVPPEVIQLTARVNQKYFVCHTAAGTLANAFICTANIDAPDGGATIVEGNRKVLAARLADARFFYDTDLKIPLEDQAKKLDRIVFHEKLGTVADKVDRVAKLARWLVEEGIILPGTGRGTSKAGGGGVPQATTSPVTPPHPVRVERSRDTLPSEAEAYPGPNLDFARSAPSTSLGINGNGGDVATLATLAERAARLCKADLVTGMVGEFPELQGLIGGYYATAQGEDPQIAAAIRDHYKPVGQGDDVPTAPVTVAVSLADKLDTIVSFFAIDERPTGSKDPFALRRAAIACNSLCFSNNVRLPLGKASAWIIQMRSEKLLEEAEILDPDFPIPRMGDQIEELQNIIDWATNARETFLSTGIMSVPDFSRSALSIRLTAIELRIREREVLRDLLNFFADRLKVQQREAGVRHDLIDAVFALGGEDDLVRLLARVHALQAFVGTADGANLLAGYKRAANILKKEGFPSSPLPSGEGQGAQAPRGEGRGGTLGESPSPDLAALGHPLPVGEGKKALSYTPEPAETALATALDAAEPRAAHAVATEDFSTAMQALATLRAPIDAFFETVIVNDPDADKRAARLALLARVRAAVHTVADFSKIVE